MNGTNQKTQSETPVQPKLRPPLTRPAPPPVDPHQAGWYNVGIASLMIVLVVLLIRAIWFSSF